MREQERSLSFKSLYYWQSQLQAPSAFFSSCLSVCVFLWRVSLKFLGFLWMLMHWFSKHAKGSMEIQLVTGTGTLRLAVLVALVRRCSAAWWRMHRSFSRNDNLALPPFVPLPLLKAYHTYTFQPNICINQFLCRVQ